MAIIITIFFVLLTSVVSSGESRFVEHTSAIKLEHVTIAASDPERPTWIDTLPSSSGENIYFVGLSDYKRSERKAKDDALAHAMDQYAKYIGVSVAIVEEVNKSITGRSSDILNASIDNKSRSEYKTKVEVCQITPVNWYHEKYLEKKNGIENGDLFKAWVLVSVPLKEYERARMLNNNKQLEPRPRIDKYNTPGSSERPIKWE